MLILHKIKYFCSPHKLNLLCRFLHKTKDTDRKYNFPDILLEVMLTLLCNLASIYSQHTEDR